MARVWPLILLAGCALLLVSAASADAPAGMPGEQSLRISTGGDSLGALLDVSAADDDSATASTPPWVGLFVLGFGGLLGVLWMATVLFSILYGAGTAGSRAELEELPPFSYRRRETKDEVRTETREDRERRPSSRSTEWL